MMETVLGVGFGVDGVVRDRVFDRLRMVTPDLGWNFYDRRDFSCCLPFGTRLFGEFSPDRAYENLLKTDQVVTSRQSF